MNNRGEDQMIGAYWFVIIFIVAAAVVYMVSVFYGHPYDVRELEASILINNVADCISQKGELNKNLIEEGKFNSEFNTNLLKECNLNFNTEEVWKDTPQYYIVVSFFKGTEITKAVFSLEQGNSNLLSNCEIANEDYQRLAKCVTERFYSTSNNEQYLVEITSIVRKSEKNVK